MHDLTIDPRAMRDSSEELAAQISALANQARSDLQQMRIEIAQATLGDSVDPAQLLTDMPEAEAQLGELMNLTRQAGNDVGLLVERMQRMCPADGGR